MTFNQALEQYRKMIRQMEMGDLQSVLHFTEELRRQLDETPDREIEMLRRLLVSRLAYKQKKPIADIQNFLGVSDVKTPLLKAESWFVQGIHFFHLGEFKTGAGFFAKASDLYFQAEWADRALLCLYNEFIGQVNAGILDEKMEEERLSYLERLALHHEQRKILGLVQRQKSFFLEKIFRLTGAEKAARDAAENLKTHGTISDYQLTALQWSDMALRNGRKAEAIEIFESLLGPYDERVLFAKDLLEAKLYGKEWPNPKSYQTVPPFWLIKFETGGGSARPATSASLTWDIHRGVLANEKGEEISLKMHSVEGQMLRLLIEKKRTKSELSALLWPEEAESTLIWDRLHKALNRLRKKTENLIAFDNTYYRLTQNISVLED